jgi:two-component system cell cycle sensor histidine kinase/response regulator CckA
MVQKKTAIESGVGAVASGEEAILRRRVAELEAELKELRRAVTAGGGALPAREALLSEAEKVTHLGSWVWDAATGNLDGSTELRHIFGLLPEAIIDVNSFLSMVHPEDRLKMPKNREDLLEKWFGGPVELRIIRPDGTLRHILVQSKRLDDDVGGPRRFLGTAWDITERKQLEEQLRQAQKMEVVGRVAGGIAHDFNNLLTVISGNADLMLEDYDDDRLHRIRDAADVGAALTKQLLAFSRQAVVKPVPLDLNTAIRDIVRIVDRLIGEDISIKLELAGEPAVILADGAQVQQILLNLAVNARDAMGNGGELIFSTRQAPGNPLKAGSEPARWVELKVQDTGKGMDTVTRERALEPFFTTKEPGKGTGLGLSTIADIVTQMKGTIAIASEPNRGTAVTIRFPHSAVKVAPAAPVELKSRKGAESILLVEDSAELRELVRLFLASAGYKVQAVGRPGEAETMWKTQKDSIDLLITDMVMPEKSGKDLAKALLAMKPGLKTLFISGYSPSRNGFGEWGFLQKPFTRNELLDSVRALCDGKGGMGNSDPGIGK